MTAPALFVSHGSPMFALQPGQLGPKLRSVGTQFGPSLSAILIVSAHWQTRLIHVMSTRLPETVHDFSGFPPALHDMRYPAKGAPELAVVARDLIAAVGYEATLDERRGLDHGAWVPLLYLAPNAATPVLQVSLGARVDAQAAIDLGSVLSSLRTEGVMIVGSGSLTHNLHEYFQGSTDTAYALEFVQWIQQALSQRDTASLVNYREAAPHARRAHPTEEHLLPLFVAYGASNDDDSMTLLDGGLDRALSMDSYLWARGSTGTEAKACAAA